MSKLNKIVIEVLRSNHYQIRNRLCELTIQFGVNDSRTKECNEALQVLRDLLYLIDEESVQVEASK